VVENAQPGDTVQVPAGNYEFPASKLEEGVVLECAPGTVFEGNSALNINGATVIGATFDAGTGSTAGTGTIHGTFKDCTFTGSETLRWCYSEAGDTVVFENCVFKTDFRGVHFDGMNGNVIFRNCKIAGFNAIGGAGTITFEGCTFGYDQSKYNGLNLYVNTNLIDCKFEYVSGKTNFIDFEAAGKTLNITNCTADGNYNGIVRDKGGKNATINVDGNPLVTSQAAFDAAIAEGKTNIYLAAGNYKLPNVQGKNITLTGAGTGTVVDYSHMGQYQEVSGSSFVFKNMTVVNAETGYPYPGLQHITSVSYEDCHIVGTVNLFAPATFTNCTFDSKSAEHNVVTCGSDSVTFTNCKFTYGDRAVNCYAEDASSRDVVVTFTDCEFTKVAGKDAVGAIETNGCYTNSLTVNINNCTVNEGQMVYISEYDTTAGGKTSITVDGEDVYVVAVGNQWADAASDAAVLKAALTSDKKNITVVLLEDVEGNFGHSSELGGANTETITINGNGHKLTLTKNYMPGFWLANDDGKLVINNATITAVRESGTWDIYDINFDNDTELNNVTFEKAVSLSGVGDTYVLNDVSISETHDYYALWISADGANVTIDGLNIDSAGRGIKIDDEYQGANVAKVTLKVSNADFNTNSKAAIMVKSAEGADIALANVDISGVAADTSNAVWVDEDAAAYADKVTVVGGIKIVEP
jgi:hypothetical protein